MKRKRMKASLLAAVILIFSVFTGDVFAEAMIVRGEITIDNGPNISFSVPVGLLQTLKTSGISAMVENKEELGRLIDSLMGELESMKDNHLLIIKVKNEVEAHVWVEETNIDEPARANLIFVDIAPSNQEPEVSLRLPQGLFFLCSFIGNQFVEAQGEEALQMIRQVFLAKIKEKHRGPNREPHHHDLPPIEEMHQRIGHLKEKIDHLRREGRHEEAEGLQREVDDIRKKIEEIEGGPRLEQSHRESSRTSEQRDRIINEAVENMLKAIQRLHEANMHDQAAQLVREAEKFRRDL